MSQITKDVNGSRDSLTQRTTEEDDALPEIKSPTQSAVIPVCDDCGEFFDSGTGLRNHVQTVHRTASTPRVNRVLFPNQCPECMVTFDSIINLEIHRNRDHKQLDSYVCYECKQVFNNREAFGKHLSKHNPTTIGTDSPKGSPNNSMSPIKNDISPIKSPKKQSPSVTPENSLLKALLNSPVTTPKKSPLISPPKSPKSVSSCKSMTSPVKDSPNQKKLECHECHKIFKREMMLEIHLNRDHYNIKPFECQMCATSFHAKGRLSNHMFTDHNISDFECPLCDYKAPRKNMLTVHMLVHSQEKPFQCDVEGCGKRFKSQPYVAQHKKGKHRQMKDMEEFSKYFHEAQQLKISSGTDKKRQSRKRSLSPNKGNQTEKTIAKKQIPNKTEPKRSPKKSKTSSQNKLIPNGIQVKFVTCEWPDCKHKFKTRTKMLEHKKKIHRNKFTCKKSDCDFRTDTFAKLNEHKRVKHSKQ